MSDGEIILALMISLFAILLPITIIGMAFEHKQKMAKFKCQAESHDADVMARLDDVTQRLEKIERRMANVETIVIEAEKAKAFERLS